MRIALLLIVLVQLSVAFLPRSTQGAVPRKSTTIPVASGRPVEENVLRARSLPASLPLAPALSVRGGALAAATAPSPPAARLWLGPAVLCSLSYALYNLFIKKGSDGIDPILGGVLLQFVAAGLGTALLAALRLRGISAGVPTTAPGVRWAALAGAAVGAAEMLSFLVSSMGVPASRSIPIIVGGSVLIGTLLSAVWLKEALSLPSRIGALLIAVGIALVGMDPGASIGH